MINNGWRLEGDILSYSMDALAITVKIATMGEARRSALEMDETELLERTAAEDAQQGFLIKVTDQGTPIYVNLFHLPGLEPTGPTLEDFARNMMPHQVLEKMLDFIQGDIPPERHPDRPMSRD